MQGDFVEAQRAFRAVPVMKSVGRVWVDSVPYHTMIGECMYKMGDLSGALQQYTTALRIFADQSDWLLSVNVPPTLSPSARASKRIPPWGPPQRQVHVADIPNMGLRMGRSPEANLQVFKEGGLVQNQYIMKVDAGEIMRCTAIAIRRRIEILGPAGEYDSLNTELVTRLTRRPAPQGSWTQAWVGVLLGLAKASVGKQDEAKAELQNSLVVLGLDHNLTSTALLELGKLHFHAQDYAGAGGAFYEAACSAVMMAEEDVAQYDVVAESFQWITICQLINAPGTVSPALAKAVEWARRGHPYVEATLLVAAAENCAGIRDTATARGYLDRAAAAARRRECLGGELGARIQFITAQVAIQSGDPKRSQTALATALTFQQKASRRLFHIQLAERLFTSGAVTTRQAGLLYEIVLREPTAHDWKHDPVESLAVLKTPHVPAFERWMLLALDRKENDNALRISEALRRHRFYTTLPLGGRIVNLRWLLEAPLEMLPQDVALQRQAIVNSYPALAEALRGMGQLKMQLDALPISSNDDAQQRQIDQLQRELEQAGELVEAHIEVLALSREPSGTLFPPTTDVTLVQQQLAAGQRVIAYVSTRNATYAFMLGPDNYSMWKLDAPAKVKADVAKMLHEMGQYDRSQPIGLKELNDDAWKATSAEVLRGLTADAPADAWNEFDELIVVPDGLLWYVPFECLQIQVEGALVPVIERVRVRYAPTVSLAVPDKLPRARDLRSAVVTGSLAPRGDDAMALELLEDLRDVDPQICQLGVKPPPAGVAVAKTVDRLVVLDDLDNDLRGPYDWTPLTVGQSKLAGSVAQWMRSPWGGPDQVLLPGFHTPAENGLKRGGTGDEMFLAVCGLMSTGTRTILLSRWRAGGRTNFDLIREFVRELPHRSAADAWQRSVRLAVSSDLAWTLEPRIKEVPPDTPPQRADHPFFWGGFMVIDTGATPAAD